MTEDEHETNGVESTTDQRATTPGKGRTPTARDIEPSVPEEFGLVQAFWGDGDRKSVV